MFKLLMVFWLLMLVVVLVDQVVLPLYQNRTLFPYFREKDLHDKIADLKQKKREKELMDKIETLKNDLKGK